MRLKGDIILEPLTKKKRMNMDEQILTKDRPWEIMKRDEIK
jgi:hypothetical protein